MKRKRRTSRDGLEGPLAGISIEITSRCPNDCVMCSRSSLMDGPGEDMKVADCRKLAKSIAESGLVSDRTWIQFTVGGEPIVHPGMCSMISAFTARGFKRIMVYSSLVCSPKLFAKFLDYLGTPRNPCVWVKLSAAHFWQRDKSGGWKDVDREQYYRRARALKKRLGSRLMFNICVPAQRLLRPTAEEVAREVGVPLGHMHPHLACDLFATHGEAARCECRPTLERCSAMTRHITVDGKLKLCCHDLSHKHTVGDVFRDGFRAAWLGKLKMFDRIAAGKRKLPRHCAKCPGVSSFRKMIARRAK